MWRSQIDNLTWSYHTNGNVDPTNLWPELCKQNQVKHYVRKRGFVNIGDDSSTVILDSTEYPELGCNTLAKRRSIVPREYCLPSPSVQIFLNMEPKKSRSLKRYKRSDKILINLQEALESTRYASKSNNKVISKLKINICDKDIDITVPKIMDRKRQSNFGRFEISISRDKNPSKLKKIILLNRHLKAQINIEKRQAFEHSKLKAICKDVDTINFSNLKISADTEINMDPVQNLRTMSLYDNDYRGTNEISIPDDTICHRPDVIQQINELWIQKTPEFIELIEGSNASAIPPVKSEIADNAIIEQTVSLRIKDIKPEEQEITEVDTKDFIKFSRNFREYCTNIVTRSLNESLENFLHEITRLQKRYHEKNPNKSKYKRRYYSGLKEVHKHVNLKKVKFVIIAPDIEKVELEDGLDDRIHKLIDTCKKQNVVFCFGLRRRKLGYFTHGKGFVGCIGIANYSGTEPLFTNALTEVVHARNAFKKHNGCAETTIDISKVISHDNLQSENINALLKALSHCTRNE